MVSLLETGDGSSRLASIAKSSVIYGSKRWSSLIDVDTVLNTAKTMNPELNIDDAIEKRRELVLLSFGGDSSNTMGVSLYFPFEYDRKEVQPQA